MINDDKTCGCCEGIEILTPLPTANRPGLTTLAYRVGSHTSFLETMKARLSSLCLGDEAECEAAPPGNASGLYPLQGLTTRAASDPAIAWLDAWAIVADVLTFYQERLANEGYLLTATERRSILELARLVGYRPRPGVAASVYLAFNLENGSEVVIPAGTRAQSMPGPGELPQSFETSEPLAARAVWNALKPRLSQPQVMEKSTPSVYLKGLGLNLKSNDPVLVVASTQAGKPDPIFRQVYQLEAEPKNDWTRVLLVGELNLDNLSRLLDPETPKIIDKTRPPVPGNPTPLNNASDIATDGLTLQWDLGQDVDPNLYTYDVDFGTQDPPPNVSKNQIATSYTIPAETLKSGTPYHWRITTISPDGCPAPGEPWHFTTEGTPPPPEPPPDDTEDDTINLNLLLAVTGASAADVEGAVNELVKQIREKLRDLQDKLRTPDLPESALKKEIRRYLDPLTEAKTIVTDLEAIGDLCKDFKPVINWLDIGVNTSVAAELNNVIQQLPVRRAIPDLPGRGFSGKYIDPAGVSQLINHRWEGEQIKFTEESSQAVEKVGKPGLRRLLDGLKTVIENKLLDEKTEEDEKILAVYQQIQWVEYLQTVFGRLRLEGKVLDTDKTLSAWIDELKTNLEATITKQSPAVTPVPGIIPLLLKAPALPPANALRLERTIRDTFAPGADIAPRVLTTFQPQLQGTLYQALAQAEATLLSPLQGFEVLRVKAAPFGAKAPLKPILNSQGIVIGYKEWPLFGVGIQLSFKRATTTGTPYIPPVLVQFLSTQDAETRYEICAITLNEQVKKGECNLRGIEVSVELGTKQVGQITFNNITINGLGNQNIEIYGARFETVHIEGKYEHTFRTSETQVSTIDGDLVTITTSAGNNPTLLIDDLSVPPPAEMKKVLALDAEYNQIRAGSWVVIEWPEGEGRPEPELPDTPNLLYRRAEKVQTISKPGYGKITQLILNKPWLDDNDRSLAVLRRAVIYTQSERLTLADEPLTGDIEGNMIKLDRLYEGLEAGRWLIVSGERTDIPGTRGVRGSELVMLAGVIQQVEQSSSNDQNESAQKDLPGGKTKTVLQLARKGLNFTYKPDTVTVYGNVVKATHGETPQEVLGSGDGSQARQTFTLKQSPLTYLAAPTPAGAESTLKLRVNEILWQEVESLIWLGANDQGYIIRADDNEQVSVIFGDGEYGARLPTGLENVKAVYRTGLGKVGNVGAERIKLLANRPLGVKEVINPLPASGGADREGRDQARRNAPLAVMALDRLVSVQDYADFARTYAGIGKTHAVRLSDGRRELILLSVAGAGDIPIDPQSDLYQNLQQALFRFGAPNRVVTIVPRELMLLIISANIRLLPNYHWEAVAPQVRTVLLETFSFDRRQLGQDVLLGEVINTIQQVPGVAYVDIDVLDSISENTPPDELKQLANVLKVYDRIQTEVGRIQTIHVVKRDNETLSSIAQRYHISEVELRQLNPTLTDQLLEPGIPLNLPRQIRPAQLVYLSPDVPDMLILTERT